jgi:hypothetical protein
MADEVAPAPPEPQAPDAKDEGRPASRVGKFIQTYSSFLSSFVIGVAGLIATSIWQYKQSDIARRQAESQQKLAEIKAENDWRIERAEILSKNLSVLSSHGPDSADQRYGVLLSLTRGNILDPELAVSYALELGKDNPDYMRSVLASTADKNYTQLAHAFQLSCLQRYGVERNVEVCATEQQQSRSDEIAALVSDELQAASSQGKPGPLSLLRDEQQVQAAPGRLAWLFEPYLSELYERRQFREIQRLEGTSVGARLVAALVLATAHTGEFVTPEEANTLEKFHQERRKWLAGYLFGHGCDGECKGKLVDAMLSVYGDAQGDYDETMRRLLLRPRAEVGAAIGRLHQRLLLCQIDEDDLALFRDRVLVPALGEALDKTKGKDVASTAAADIAALLAICPPPADPPAKSAYDAMLDRLRKDGDRYQKNFVTRRKIAERERADPPPALRKLSFCEAAERDEAARKEEGMRLMTPSFK